MIEVIKKPLTATIIEEIKLPPPPPPPPKKIIEPPKVAAAGRRPTFRRRTFRCRWPTTAPVITAATAAPPPEPHVIAAAGGRGAACAAEAGGAPRHRRASRGDDPDYPREAIRAGIDKGRVVARLNIDEKGNVTEVTIFSADPPRDFDKAVIEALKEWKFAPDGEKYVGEVEINFTLKDS